MVFASHSTWVELMHSMTSQVLSIPASPKLSRRRSSACVPTRLRRAAAGVAIAALLMLALTGAEVVGGPMASVKDTVNEVVALVGDPAYKSTDLARQEKLREVIAPHFDFTDMARSVMDYHWRTLSQAQRDEFVQVFTGLLEASFIGKIEGYKGQKIVYVEESSDGHLAQVNTDIMQQGSDAIAINYRLRQSGGTWKVYDVLVDQMSLVSNYRNQFNRIMNKNGYDTLISAIKLTQARLP
jgi:phospholipid transport system substrate-binding protein